MGCTLQDGVCCDAGNSLGPLIPQTREDIARHSALSTPLLELMSRENQHAPQLHFRKWLGCSQSVPTD